MSYHGWLILDKPLGMSSAHAVSRVKRLLNLDKIGHGGTLDPLATGLLPLALGEATKVSQYILESIKAYEFSITWGEDRETMDGEGDVIKTSDLRPSEEKVEQVIASFLGPQLQIPPVYSALKVQGKRACDRARDGENVTLAPREINVFDLKLCHYEKNLCTFYVKCSKGTYVRSLGQDIAHRLETCGYISMLRRVQTGPFTLDRALSLENLAKAHEKGLLKNYVSSIHGVLDDIPALALSGEHLIRLQQGQRLSQSDVTLKSDLTGLVLLQDDQDTLWGLGLFENSVLHPKRMFVYEPNKERKN